MRWGWHLVTNCQRANQGKKSHKDVESILIHYFNTYTHITATKAKPFANSNMQADILLSGITTIDNPDGKDVHIDVTSTNPMGTSNQDLMNRYRPARQPDPSEHDGRNNTLVSAVWAESKKHAKYDNLCAAAGTTFSPFALETMGAHEVLCYSGLVVSRINMTPIVYGDRVTPPTTTTTQPLGRDEDLAKVLNRRPQDVLKRDDDLPA